METICIKNCKMLDGVKYRQYDYVDVIRDNLRSIHYYLYDVQHVVIIIIHLGISIFVKKRKKNYFRTECLQLFIFLSRPLNPYR